MPIGSTDNSGLSVGFADDSQFYLVSGDKVATFPKSAVGDMIGRPVAFTVLASKDFFVNENAPGGGGDDSGGDHGDSGKSGEKGEETAWF